MSDALAIEFNDDDAAREALRTLRVLEKDGKVSFSDTAIVARDDAGELYVRNELDSSTERGMTIGTLVGALFGPLGLVGGFLGGTAIGASQNDGVDDAQVEQVEREIRPGMSVLFLAIREANPEALVATLSQHRGRVLRSTLTPDAVDVLNLAMGDVQPADGGALEAATQVTGGDTAPTATGDTARSHETTSGANGTAANAATGTASTTGPARATPGAQSVSSGSTGAEAADAQSSKDRTSGQGSR